MLAKMGEMRRTPGLSDKRAQDEYQENNQTLAKSQQLAASWQTMTLEERVKAMQDVEPLIQQELINAIGSLPFSDELQADANAQYDILQSALTWYRSVLANGQVPSMTEAVRQALAQTKYGQ